MKKAHLSLRFKLLLQLGSEAQQAGSPGPWQLVLPQYPTSPVAAL